MQDFFAQQERAQGKSARLVVLFILAVALVVAGTYFIALLLQDAGSLFSNLSNFVDGKLVEPRFWRPGLFVIDLFIVLAITGLAYAYRLHSLRGGGAAVAAMAGARIVPPGTRDPKERQLLNVVEEMSIASGAPVPWVYVMDEEQGINAFAAGYAMEDAAVTVTRGLIDRLDRDEMQAVVAHEFSHIFRGDMRLNIRLIAALFGIAVLGIMGRQMLAMLPRTRHNSEGGGIAFVLLLAGAMLTLLGAIGLMMGRVIKAAVSRQREYLADAAAVQYTRNPGALAGALGKIAERGSVMMDRRSSEFSHLFIADGAKWSFSRLLATHPPLQERIRRLDPAGRYARQAEAARSLAGEPSVPDEAPIAGFGGGEASPLAALPLPLREGLVHPLSSAAAIYAMLLSPELALREKQYALIRERAGELQLQETLRLEGAVEGLDERQLLPGANLALPALRNLNEDQRQAFAVTLNRLMEADGEISVREFAIARTLLRRLDASSTRSGPARPLRSREILAKEAAVLLGVLARLGNVGEEAVTAAFAAGCERMATHGAGLALPPAAACTLSDLGRALDLLARAPLPARGEMLAAATACVEADGKVTVTEEELLRTVALALELRLPPRLAA